VVITPDVDPNTPFKDQMEIKVQYQPIEKDLQQERPEDVERLDFFREPFIFSYDQISVFWKTLIDLFNPPIAKSEDDEEDRLFEEDG